MKLQGLNFVFEKLNNPDTRKPRWKIIKAYSKYLVENNLKTEFTPENFHEHTVIDLGMIDPSLQGDITRVKSDFEEIAIMAKHGFIVEDAYFDAYSGTLLRCYAALHGNIDRLREKLGSQHYTKYYEEQTKSAVKYWKNKAPSDLIRFHYEIETQ
jgi:hypothetical protein